MNRGFATHNKESRRVRLWLKHETWAKLDQEAGEQAWDRRAPTAIEKLLDRWANGELVWASSARSSTGPVEL